MEAWVNYLIHFITTYGYIFIFFGTIVGGDIVVLAALFLAFLGYFNVFFVLYVSFIGTMLSDSLLYMLGYRYERYVYRVADFFGISRKYISDIESHFNNHYAKFIVGSKLVYGTRMATIIACGHQKVAYEKFFRYNFIGTVMWLALLVFLGYFLNFSWALLEQYNHNIRYWIFFAVLAFVIFKLLFYSIKILRHGSRS